jgi:hypothetical protein
MCRRNQQEEFDMTKSKPAQKVKPAAATKIPRKVSADRAKAVQSTPRANSKQAEVIAMLRQPQGSTISAIMKATGWQPHSIRGFFAGVVRKKFGLTLESERPDDGDRIYRIVVGKQGNPRLKADKSNRRVA